MYTWKEQMATQMQAGKDMVVTYHQTAYSGE